MTNEKIEGADRADSAHEARNKEFREAFYRATDKAQDASEKARRAAENAASTMSDHVMEILNDQLGVGAESVSRFASSMRLAANDLARESPVLAGLVRGFAQNVDGYVGRLEDQTIQQLARSASDFARRQPALTFGLAAVAGFFALRTFKNAQRGSSPPIQPKQYYPGG
jgi:ElaB/YqjD/DUF883 family membrane-anchored ribosome-binding protein